MRTVRVPFTVFLTFRNVENVFHEAAVYKSDKNNQKNYFHKETKEMMYEILETPFQRFQAKFNSYSLIIIANRLTNTYYLSMYNKVSFLEIFNTVLNNFVSFQVITFSR